MKFTQNLFRTCNCYNCEQELLTLEEIRNRICKYHFKIAQDDDYFVGVCWECGNITITESRQWDRKTREYTIPSKYIFSKGCKACTGNNDDNINWMTIPKESEEIVLSSVAVVEITNQDNRLFDVYHDES